MITKSEDIEEIYQTFESVSLKDKTTEPIAGGSVTSFRFNLSDGTSYEVIYSEVAVKLEESSQQAWNKISLLQPI